MADATAADSLKETVTSNLGTAAAATAIFASAGVTIESAPAASTTDIATGGASTETVTALEDQVDAANERYQDLEKRYNATEAKVNDESLPEWSIGVFAALGVLALLVAIVLCMVIKCEREGKPIFTPLERADARGPVNKAIGKV